MARSSPTTSSYVVTPHFFAGAYPGHQEIVQHCDNLDKLLNAGVNVFINLMEANERNWRGEPFRRYGHIVAPAKLIRASIEDRWIPSIGKMRAILDRIDAELSEGNTIYLHCWGGVGRTGTVVGCWLIRHGIADASNVLGVLNELRRDDLRAGHRNAPETVVQEEFVKSWDLGQ